MTTIETLRKFCWDVFPEYSEPSSEGDYTYATNSLIAIRVPRVAAARDHEDVVDAMRRNGKWGEKLGISSLPWDHAERTEWAPIENYPHNCCDVTQLAPWLIEANSADLDMIRRYLEGPVYISVPDPVDSEDRWSRCGWVLVRFKFEGGCGLFLARKTSHKVTAAPNTLAPFTGQRSTTGRKTPYIICAAIWFDDGRTDHKHQPKNIESGYVVAGRRHHNCVATHLVLAKQKIDKGAKQGFLTSDDLFVTRKDAGRIAFDAGQIRELTDCLMSEDLY